VLDRDLPDADAPGSAGPLPPDTATSHLRWLAGAVLVGLATGALTLGGQAVLPVEANRLANSGAIWVTVAFLVGWRTPSDLTAAIAGLITLVGALVGYFLAAALSNAGVSASTVAIWVGVAIVGGPVFGLAGRWRATRTGWWPVLAVALLGAVYLAEGVWTLLVIPHMAVAGWVSVAAGVVITLLGVSDHQARLRACALLVPLTALGVAGYAAVDAVFGAV
jgi:hypothetical protein